MSLSACRDCSTQYASDLSRCPHCGSTVVETEDGTTRRRLPTLVFVQCGQCGWGPASVRLDGPRPGLITIPNLHCASCGSQVQVPWPPTEDSMPKITLHGGATNARDTEPSPAVVASQPQVVAEDDLGHPSDAVEEVAEATPAEAADAVSEPDYAGLTLAELRSIADERGVPSYGTKAQITERLMETDAS